MSFRALKWLAISNPVKVFVSPLSSNLNLGPGVEFLLPAGTQELALRYTDGAGIALAINGVEPNYPGHAGFSFLDGATLGGVTLSTDVTSGGSSYEVGTLDLHGPINSLRIAGLELFLDDILARVPEPGAAALLLATAVIAILARRRQS